MIIRQAECSDLNIEFGYRELAERFRGNDICGAVVVADLPSEPMSGLFRGLDNARRDWGERYVRVGCGGEYQFDDAGIGVADFNDADGSLSSTHDASAV